MGEKTSKPTVCSFCYWYLFLKYYFFKIDSIVKQSHKALGASEPYAERFAQNLSVTLEPVTSLNKDIKLLIYRAIQTWAERNLFSESAIKSLGGILFLMLVTNV